MSCWRAASNPANSDDEETVGGQENADSFELESYSFEKCLSGADVEHLQSESETVAGRPSIVRSSNAGDPDPQHLYLQKCRLVRF